LKRGNHGCSNLYLWHLGAAALSAQLIYRSWRYPFQDQTFRLVLEAIAGIIYGLTIFIIGIEGGTVAIMFPFSIIAAVTALILGWGKFKRMPVLSCFTVGYTLAALVYLGWGLYWGGFPQFSHLGWI
jgi:hypothetical protein